MPHVRRILHTYQSQRGACYGTETALSYHGLTAEHFKSEALKSQNHGMSRPENALDKFKVPRVWTHFSRFENRPQHLRRRLKAKWSRQNPHDWEARVKKIWDFPLPGGIFTPFAHEHRLGSKPLIYGFSPLESGAIPSPTHSPPGLSWPPCPASNLAPSRASSRVAASVPPRVSHRGLPPWPRGSKRGASPQSLKIARDPQGDR